MTVLRKALKNAKRQCLIADNVASSEYVDGITVHKHEPKALSQRQVRELVTLASVIEREAKVPGERPIIASVFYNRLALGMPLQSDPTAQYNFAGETMRAVAAVRAPSAFNTYEFAGLPPGPIANPGLSSIRAALYPAHTDYLYFVARNDGTHIFSRSFKEHEHAIEEVRRMAAQAHRPKS